MWQAESSGKPINNVEVKIAADGEILCKGPNVMIGYYKEPVLTAEALADGWFHTGDIGEIREGFLFITDRKKEMFKTSGGKYVSPQLIENALKESVFIEQVMVIGEGRNFPGALVVPDFVVLQKWAKENGIRYTNNEDLCKSTQVNTQFKREIDEICSRFAKWEQVKEFRLLPNLFSIEAGEITPTLKLKRKGILANYHTLVEDIYRHSHHDD
jgi:long-chain acyl-CoA synthetase